MRKIMEDFINYIKVRSQCIWIRTDEEDLTIQDIKNCVMLSDPNITINIWSRTEGLSVLNSSPIKEQQTEPNKSYADISKLFSFIRLQMYGGLDDDENEISPQKNIFILRDYDSYLNNPDMIRYIRDLKEYSRKKEAYNPIIILSQSDKIPNKLTRLFKLIEYGLPEQLDICNMISEISNAVINKAEKENRLDEYEFIEDKNYTDIAKSCSGLTLKEVKDTILESYIRFKKIDLDFVTDKKIQSVKKSGVLDYKIPQITLDDVGGNHAIKKWLLEIKELFSIEAKQFGLKRPKGYLSVGVPGAGKTCLAEAFAGTMNTPLLSLNMGKIMSRFVGESEQKIIQALNVAKASAPCVLLIDEVEKALGGINSSNQVDGGVTARVFMEILKFLNDNDYGIYIIMTSNDVSQLPPELTRSGRLDAQWYFGFPKEDERKEIFKIHFNKYNKTIDNKILDSIINETNNFTGAEIEQTVKHSMRKAFIRYKKDKDENIKEEDILSAIKEVIPVYKSSKESILALQAYCLGRARNTDEDFCVDNDIYESNNEEDFVL